MAACAAMKEVAKMILNHFGGIIAWAQTRQTNGFLEAINGRFRPPSAEPGDMARSKRYAPSSSWSPETSTSPASTLTPRNPLQIQKSPQPSMPRSATMQMRPIAKRWRRRSITGSSAFTSAVLPGHISVQMGAPLAIHDEPRDHLLQIWPEILRVAVLAQRFAALAVKGQAGGVHERGGEIAEQIATFIEQLFLDDVLDALMQRGANASAGFTSSSSPSRAGPWRGK
jgi:Transposase